MLGKPIGRGTLVNILTTANTGWSNLALSGLFPAMLARLATIGQGAPTNPQTEFPLQASLTAFGTLGPPAGPGATLTSAIRNSASVSAKQPPGLYGAAGSTIALNLGGHVPPQGGGRRIVQVIPDVDEADADPIAHRAGLGVEIVG